MMLENKVAIITGASSDVGKAIAKRFSEEGANLSLTYCSNYGTIQKLETELREKPIVTKVDFNISNGQGAEECIKSIKDCVKRIRKKYGKIDILVNSAGIWIPGLFIHEKLSDFYKTMDVNLLGPYLFMQQVIPKMINQKEGGSIINISSTAAFKSIGLQAAYSISKAGLVGLTKSTANEFAKFKIRVNAIAPGLIDTKALYSHFDAYERKRYGHSIPASRLAKPEDVVGAAVYLASEDSKYVTGIVLPVDGGG